jgi:hypothetical protein
MNRKDFIKKHYYKSWQTKNKNQKEEEYFNLIFRLLQNLNIDSAFEVAIGDGEPFAKKIAEHTPVEGIDLSTHLVDMANRNEGINASYGDAETFKIESYDLIYCLRSFWYFDKWKAVLKSMIIPANKYILFDILNGDNKDIIFNEISFRRTLFGKLYVAFKNTIKLCINLLSFKQRYFMQTLTPLENYHFHHEIIDFIKNSADINIDYYGIVTRTKNQIDNDKDYRIIYILTK